MAYTMRIEDLARDYHAVATARGVAAALGQDTGPPLNWDELKDAFDDELNSPLEPVKAEEEDRSPRGIKLRALGIEQGR